MPHHIPFPEPTSPVGPSSSGGDFFFINPGQHSAQNLHGTLATCLGNLSVVPDLHPLTVPVPYTGRTSSLLPSTHSYTAHRPHPPFPVTQGQELQAERQPSPSYSLPAQDVSQSQSRLGVSGADQFAAAYQRHCACVPYPAISSLNKRWCERSSGRFG